MTEESKVQASGTQDGATGTPAIQVPATDADWKAERIKAQRQAKAALAENEQLKQKLAEIENAKKSEHEKAIEEAAKKARESTLSEVQAQMLQKDIRTEIRLKLAEAGVPANQVAVILDEAKPESVDEAVTAAQQYAERWKSEIAKPAAPAGVGGSPTPRVGQAQFKSSDVRKMDRKTYQENYSAIEAAKSAGTFVYD